MTIELNHTIVPAHDNEASARFYQEMFGFECDGPLGHFAPVRIAGQALTLDFDTRERFHPQHYAFKVSEEEFDQIFGRIEARGLVYGSGPMTPEDGSTPAPIRHTAPAEGNRLPIRDIIGRSPPPLLASPFRR